MLQLVVNAHQEPKVKALADISEQLAVLVHRVHLLVQTQKKLRSNVACSIASLCILVGAFGHFLHPLQKKDPKLE